MNGTRALKPALLSFCFARIGSDPDESSPALEHLRTIWDACDDLQMEEPNDDLNEVGTAFPDGFSVLRSFEMLAAKRRPGKESFYSALLFADHDVAGVGVALAPNDTASGLDGWSPLYEEWCDATGGARAPPDALGEVFVFQALCEGSAETLAELRSEVSRQIPPDVKDATAAYWREAFCVTSEGFALWDVADPVSEEAIRRVICALVPRDRERNFDLWAWAATKRRLMPFQSYLLHTSKLRHEYRVWGSARSVNEIRREIEDGIEPLLRRLRETDEGKPIAAKDLLEAQRRLTGIETDTAGLLDRITRLRELRRTVKIAEANFSMRLPAEVQRGAGSTLFDRDRDLGRWLRSQIDNDLDYLEAIHERARRVEELTAERLTQAAETRHDRLMLFQTSVIGALLMALGYMQATQLRIPLDAPLRWPLLALLSALALGLPVGVLRWFGALRASGPYWVLDFIAVGLLGAASAYFALKFGWWVATDGSAPGPLSGTVALLGFAAFVSLTWLIDRLREPVPAGDRSPA